MTETKRPIHILGAWAKINRVKEQISYLTDEVNIYQSCGYYKILGEYQPGRQRYAFKLIGPPVPSKFAVLAGEIIHHLRCCFDHVAWSLAEQSGVPADRARNIFFPVCDTKDQFQRSIRNGSLFGASGIHLSTIESLQPYNTSDPGNSIIKSIHDLDIIDKHRLLVVVSHTLVMGDHLTITKNDPPVPPDFGIELPPLERDLVTLKRILHV
jgi:hypothetical protein